MNEPLTDNRLKAHGLAGDFWYSKIKEDHKEIIRALQQSVFFNTAAYSILKESVDWALSNPIVCENFSIRLDRKNTLVVSRDMQIRIRTVLETEAGTQLVLLKPNDREFGMAEPWYTLKYPPEDYIVQTLDGEYILYPTPSADDSFVIPKDWIQTLHITPVERGLSIRGIISKYGLMLHGIDFLQRGIFLLFKEDPFTIFPDGIVPVLSADKTKRPLHSFYLSTDYGSSELIAKYKKRASTPENFKIAAASAAGLAILPESGTLLNITKTAQGYTYSFTFGDITVNYPHDKLTINEFYQKGHLIGAGFKIKNGRKDPFNKWWRSFDWSSGLSLDGLCPFEGLTVNDSPQVFTAYAQTGNKLHVRFPTTTDSELDDKFWAHVKQCEIWSNKYLNDVIGLTYLNETALINPLDFLFEHLLEDRSIVVELDRKLLGDSTYFALKAFLKNEKPVGYVLIIREAS
jgi:hypothetical protein